jgi:hypothetical protein
MSASENVKQALAYYATAHEALKKQVEGLRDVLKETYIGEVYAHRSSVNGIRIMAVNQRLVIANITYFHDHAVLGGTKDYDGDLIDDCPYYIDVNRSCACCCCKGLTLKRYKCNTIEDCLTYVIQHVDRELSGDKTCCQEPPSKRLATSSHDELKEYCRKMLCALVDDSTISWYCRKVGIKF